MARRRRTVCLQLTLSCFLSAAPECVSTFAYLPDHRPLIKVSDLVVGDLSHALDKVTSSRRSPCLMKRARRRGTVPLSTTASLRLITVMYSRRPNLMAQGLSSICGTTTEHMTATCWFQIHHLSSTLRPSVTPPSHHLPALPLFFPTGYLPPGRRFSQCSGVVGERSLGFSSLGPTTFGPSDLIMWPNFFCGGLARFSRPRYVITHSWTSSVLCLCLPKVSNCRGLFSNLVVGLIQGLVNLHCIVTASRCIICTFEPVSTLHYKFNDYQILLFLKVSSTSLISTRLIHVDDKGLFCSTASSNERCLSPISSHWEKSLPPSSLIRERIFTPISLSMRGKDLSVFSVSNPRNCTTLLTVLLSCVAVCSGPEDTTSLISIRLGGRGAFSTSLVKVTMRLTSDHDGSVKPKSVDELGLITASFTGVLVLVVSHISPDGLSSFLKFVSLSLSFACFKFLAIMFAFGICPIKLNYYVTL